MHMGKVMFVHYQDQNVVVLGRGTVSYAVSRSWLDNEAANRLGDSFDSQGVGILENEGELAEQIIDAWNEYVGKGDEVAEQDRAERLERENENKKNQFLKENL